MVGGPLGVDCFSEAGFNCMVPTCSCRSKCRKKCRSKCRKKAGRNFFSAAGALRNAKEEIVKRFLRAYGENPDMAMKIHFFTRDVREGLGCAAGPARGRRPGLRRWLELTTNGEKGAFVVNSFF